MDICLESKEPISVEIESIAVHEEVPNEKAAVKTVRALKERKGGCRVLLTAEKKHRAMVGSWKKWAATRRGMKGWTTIPFLHRAWDIVIRYQVGTVVYKEHRKDKRSGRDVGHTWNAAVE
jgi:hypothetical protein